MPTPNSGGEGVTSDAVRSIDPEVLKEDTDDVTYAEDAWVNFTVTRALVAGDDNSLIELSMKIAGTSDLWDVFLLPADRVRHLAFNTFTNVTANPGFRFKVLRHDATVSEWSHSAMYFTRRTATGWRFAQGHVLYDRISVRLLPR